uniref:Master replication protein n=1 Tax=Banana bunchy top virus TaxID=12585 RepID=A0A0R7FF94_BBTV|nr:Replication associated protein [Banana bunchy top virus]AKO71384.1 Replication associated protein [Banana bunchy top virus]AKO71386.1 Replication associated protein [Banana bunchy top virus]WET17405.1 replication associated protein [Banana bunchy top virus]WET17408.1 replication associated protein [Banana bunchy top virus]
MARYVVCWMFTINNPASLPVMRDEFKYMVYQVERGQEGTRHVQGYVEMKRRSSLKQMRGFFPGAHLEKRKGSQEEARAYCMKEDTRIEGPFEFGAFKLSCNDNLFDVIQDMRETHKRPLEYLYECPNTFDRSKDTLYRVQAELNKTKAMNSWKTSFSSWTSEVENIMAEPCHRRIIWVYGPNGGEGKTTYAKYLMKTKNAFYSPGGKSLDICRLYNYEEIVIFDIPRCKEEYLNYGLLEEFKNGIIQSGKYEPVLKIVEYVEVIVMANFLPKEGIFSEDRIKLVAC